MGKRLFLATALSFLVLFVWSSLITKTQPIVNKEVISRNLSAEESTVIHTPRAQEVAVVTPASFQPPSVSTVKVVSERCTLVFNESLAALQEVSFTGFQNSRFVLGNGFALADPTLNFKVAKNSSSEINFVHRDARMQVTKRFLVSNSNYTIDLEIRWENLTTSPLTVSIPLIAGSLDMAGAKGQAQYHEVMVNTPEKTFYSNGQRDAQWPDVNFMGLRDRYFCLIIQPDAKGYNGFTKRVSAQQLQLGLGYREETMPAGGQIGHKFQVYLGPQLAAQINKANPAWSQIIHYGTFNIIAQLMAQLLEFLSRLVHNWGLAIIFFSVIVYILLYPLSLKQMRSMKEMNALKPHIEALRNLHKDNPQKLNKEMMDLYRRHKINPLGGCLPLILQLPIFFALYQVLMRSVALKGARFLWIKDLSEPDRLFLLPRALPILGNEVNILPIVMAVLMLIQQKFSLTSTGTGSKEQEKMMLIIFPVMFGFIFYRMPSGLVLYWLVNSVLMILFQLRIASKHG